MRARREDEAKALCGGCPVRQECFNGALARREEHGVWGGHAFPYDAQREAAREARRTERRIGAAVAAARGMAVVAGDSGGITRAPRGRQEVLAS